MYKNCTNATLILSERKKRSNLLVTLILIKIVQAVFVHATSKYKILMNCSFCYKEKIHTTVFGSYQNKLKILGTTNIV